MRSLDVPFGSHDLVSGDPLASGFSDDAVAVAQLAYGDQVRGMEHLPGARRLAGAVGRAATGVKTDGGDPVPEAGGRVSDIQDRRKNMSIRDTAWNAVKWKVMKDHLGYTDEEMKVFRENPRNEEVLSKAPALMQKTIVLEVVQSHGCNSQHKVGDKFIFDGAGNLLTKRCPKKVCIYALKAATSMIFASNELFYAGIDPNEMRFRRAACFDVGVQCGGWGRIVLELSVQDRKEA
jgi:uncharacterized repeat protein (TIGR04076 family)